MWAVQAVRYEVWSVQTGEEGVEPVWGKEEPVRSEEPVRR